MNEGRFHPDDRYRGALDRFLKRWVRTTPPRRVVECLALKTTPDRVPEPLFRRHLGLPAGVVLDPSLALLATTARDRYARWGRPWADGRVHVVREIDAGKVWLEGGLTLSSALLAEGFLETGTGAVVVAGLSAGAGIERWVKRLWRMGRPDEAVFLNAYAIAVVEHLRFQLGRHLRETLAGLGLGLLPHYSPGYPGWDLQDQSAVIRALQDSGPIRRLPSGGLTPSKSTLAVFGVAGRPASRADRSDGFWDRRVHRGGTRQTPAVDLRASYAFPEATLEKWRRDRLVLTARAGGRIRATFHLNGSTCTNMGLPLGLDYRVELQLGPRGTYLIRGLDCQPARGDLGHRSTCLFLLNPREFQAVLHEFPPFQGKPLRQVLAWNPETNPGGCVCTRSNRDHKWRIVFQTLHYALTHAREDGQDEIRSTRSA